MYGRSAAIFVVSLGLVLSCAHNVGQDDHSGADKNIKGAKPIALDQGGEGHANGIVTYPGGDRTDWKMVELPDKKKGQLDLKLTWQPPRPNLQLAFDVFDEWNTLVMSSSKTSKKRSHGRTKELTLDNAKGKYFIRIYAVDRGDAGKYKLAVTFKESVATVAPDFTKLDIPDPPRLAAIPEAEVPCDEFTFDVKNPACKKVCPKQGAPAGWPPCAGQCPTPPDVNVPSCWDTMPCPADKPMKKIKACKPTDWPKCDLNKIDPENPNCPDHLPPITARVIKNELQNGEMYITIGAGSEQGVTKDWTVKVLAGQSGDSPLGNGDVQIIRIGKRDIVGKTKLSAEQVNANPRVQLTPPRLRP